MAAFKPSSLKVVELRQELSSRGLPTKGKKDELVARLTEALAAENSKETSEEQQTVDSQPVQQNTATEVPSETEVAEKQDDSITKQSTDKSTESKPADKSVEEQPSAIEEHAETSIANQSLKAPMKEATEDSKDQPMEETVEAAKDQPVHEKPAETNNDQTMKEANESSANEKNVSKKEESKLDTSEDISMETNTDKSSTNQNQTDKKQKEEESIDTTEASTNSQADETTNDENDKNLKRKAESIDEAKQEKKAKLEESNDGVNSNSIYVKGFVRPLIIRQVQDLFGKYGNVKRFWMDNIKTHCYVVYEKDSEASEAFNKVNGITFPPDTGKALSVGGLTSEQTEQLISFEQSAAERRIRVDWEANIEKLKAGEELSSTPTSDSKKTRTIGIGQIAKQLAQAATSTPAVTASRTPTPTQSNEKAPEQNDSNLSLEDLFKKTKALPHLYYLPVSEEIAKERLAKLLK